MNPYWSKVSKKINIIFIKLCKTTYLTSISFYIQSVIPFSQYTVHFFYVRLSSRDIDKSKLCKKLFSPVHEKDLIFFCKMRAFKPILYELKSLFVGSRLLIFFKFLRKFVNFIFWVLLEISDLQLIWLF